MLLLTWYMADATCDCLIFVFEKNSLAIPIVNF
jgi:hypothetical protein